MYTHHRRYARAAQHDEANSKHEQAAIDESVNVLQRPQQRCRVTGQQRRAAAEQCRALTRRC
jgi:hypothetical protein